MNVNDLRVVKTKKNIENALIDLLQKKNFHEITVRDILSVALINRSTFYKHYADKYALAENLCQDIFALFREFVEQRFLFETKTEEMIDIIKELYRTLSQNSSKVLALFKIKTETIHLYDDMFCYLKNKFLENKKETGNFSSKLCDYLATVYATFVMESIRWCLENDSYEDIRPYAKNIVSLIPFFSAQFTD